MSITNAGEKGTLSRYSRGWILCCKLINDAYVYQGNSRIHKSIEDVPVKVWKTIKDLEIEGEEDNEVFESIVRDIEARDQKRFEAMREIAIRVP